MALPRGASALPWFARRAAQYFLIRLDTSCRSFSPMNLRPRRRMAGSGAGREAGRTTNSSKTLISCVSFSRLARNS